MTQYVVVHFGEISTRGRNKPYFVRRLQQNIVESVKHVCELKTKILDSRLLLEVEAECVQEVLTRLSKTFGIAWFAEAEVLPLNYSEIRDHAISLLNDSKRAGSATFGVYARRSNKNWEHTSMELASMLGKETMATTGLKVDLTNPDVTLYVDVVRDAAIMYTSKVRGLRGLPVGVSGKVVHLLSGGVDSAVAAWLLMKRGCEPVNLHFYAASSAEEVLSSKLPKVLKHLSQYSSKGDLLLFPFSPYLVSTLEVSAVYEPVLFRYFMRTVAEKLALKIGALAISTGDSLAQVASQTLENLGVFDHESLLPVLRPLLTYDKQEIIEMAKQIGFFDICASKYKDCCSMISTHPKTKVNKKELRQLSAEIGFEKLAEKVLELGSALSYDRGTDVFKLQTLNEFFKKTGSQTRQSLGSSQE